MRFEVRGPAIMFCPGDRPDRFDKAYAVADAVILDLEDAVAPESKERARRQVVEACDRTGATLIVRVNAVGTPWYEADVRLLRESAANRPTLMLPKAMVAHLDDIDDFEVIALLETAAGVMGAASVAAKDNCVALLCGAEDLTADLGGRSSRSASGAYHPTIEHARAATRLAAGAAGKAAIDTVFVDIADLAGLAVEAEQAADLGFVAKACLHPSQVPVVRAAYAPSASQRDWALAVLARADEHGTGVFVHEGRMVDAPLLAHARAIVSHSSSNASSG